MGGASAAPRHGGRRLHEPGWAAHPRHPHAGPRGPCLRRDRYRGQGGCGGVLSRPHRCLHRLHLSSLSRHSPASPPGCRPQGCWRFEPLLPCTIPPSSLAPPTPAARRPLSPHSKPTVGGSPHRPTSHPGLDQPPRPSHPPLPHTPFSRMYNGGLMQR